LQQRGQPDEVGIAITNEDVIASARFYTASAGWGQMSKRAESRDIGGLSERTRAALVIRF
jgi:hypothetical protein